MQYTSKLQWMLAQFRHSRRVDKPVERAARLAIEMLERRVMLSVDSWTGGGDGVNWSDPPNWSSGIVPGAADDVVVDAQGTTINVNVNSSVLAVNGNANLYVTGSLSVSSGASLVTGSFSMGGGATIAAMNGATLTLPGVTSYTKGGGTQYWDSSGTGSVLSLPNLSSMTNFSDWLRLDAESGGEINLPALASVTTNNFGVTSDDTGSLVNLAELSTFNDPGGGEDYLNATNGGHIVDPLVTSATFLSLTITGSGSQMNTTQLTSLIYGSISVDQAVNFNALTDADNSSFSADNGATLSLPGIATYNKGGATQNWDSSGTGSALSLPNLSSMTNFPDWLRLDAESGGEINLPVLTSVTTNNFGATSNGTGSLVSVPQLSEITDPTFGDDYLNATNGGTINAGEVIFSVDHTVALAGNVMFSPSELIAISAGSATFNGSLLSGVSLQLGQSATVNLDQGMSVAGLLTSLPGSTINVTANLTGATTLAGQVQLEGPVVFNGNGTSTSPQLLEAMSADLGATATGFIGNFAYNSLQLTNNTYVELVNQSENSSQGGSEAVYVNSLIVPSGTTLNLNGLHLYARLSSIEGMIIGGSVTTVPPGGVITLGIPSAGTIQAAGQNNQWTFFSRQGEAVTLDVNPGSTGTDAPAVAPDLSNVTVQLLSSSGTVIASGSNSNNAPLILPDIILPADDTYTIKITASAAAPQSTGNYTITAWSSTPVVQAATFNETQTGDLLTPYAVDQWTIAGSAGQQVKFHLAGESSSAITFSLTGPNVYTAFSNASTDSSILSLPTSGTYTLSVTSLTGATGTYAFSMNLTTTANLALDGTYTGSLVVGAQSQIFTVSVTTPEPLFISLADTGADHNELYVQYESAPTQLTYGYAATGAGASQQILVPDARAGTWYILLYTETVAAPPTPFMLTATGDETVLTAATPTEGAANTLTTLTLTGAGFNSGSKVNLISSTGTVYPVTSTVADLPTQITATIAAGTVPAGTYTIRVTQADSVTANLPNAFTMVSTGQAVLTTHIDIPNPIGYHIASTLYVDYSNTGTVAMPAPLLVLSATLNGIEGALMTLDASLQTSGFWTSATPQGYSQFVQILGSGATPGVLQPGETERVPVYYAGWLHQDWDLSYSHPIYFTLNVIQANDTTAVNWSASKATLQPPNIDNTAWNTVFSSLQTQLGTTSGGYVQLLDSEANYLGQLGEDVTDVQSLWSFAVQQADNTLNPLAPTLASVTDDSLDIPGSLSLSFSRSYAQSISGRDIMGSLGFGWSTPWQSNVTVGPDGTVTVNEPGGGERIFQPDSRYSGVYFSSPGDTGTLTSDGNGGYQLTEANGIATDYSSNGTLHYEQDTNGNRITAGYTNGLLTSLTASSGQFIEIGYNAAELISTVTDSVGRVTTYTYDPTNQYLVSVLGYNGETTQYAYNTTAGSASQNSLTTITYPGNTHQYFTYDSMGRLASTYSDGGAQPSTFTYNLGEVTTTNGVNVSASSYYNENGLISRSVDGNGNPTYYGYDSNFNLVQVTNAAGQSQNYTYNAAGEVTSSTDYLGNVTKYAYSGSDNDLSSFTDANGNVTNYSYSSAGNLLSTTYANNTQSSSTFNPLGEATSFLNQNGQGIRYTYNAAGQMTQEQFSDGTVYTYTYDAYGNLLTATDPTGTTTFTYAPVTEWLTSVVYSNGTSLTFSYNAAGQRTKMVDQTGFTVNYQYDSVGRLSGLTDGSGNSIVVYTYNAAGELVKKFNGNGTYTTYTYDGDGNVLDLMNYAPNGTINSIFVYT